MSSQKVRPCITVVTRLRPKTCFKEHVLDRLPRDDMPELPQRLDDLGVSPAGLLLDSNDGFIETLRDPRAASLGGRDAPVAGGIFEPPHPFAKRLVADDGDQSREPSSQRLAMLHQPPTLLVGERDPLRQLASEQLILCFEVGHLSCQLLAGERSEHGKKRMENRGHWSDKDSACCEGAKTRGAGTPLRSSDSIAPSEAFASELR